MISALHLHKAGTPSPKHWIRAAVALLAGVLVYWLTRETLPAVVPDFFDWSLRTAWIINAKAVPLVDNLPSFFHCYALIAATAALQFRDRAFLLFGIISNALLCLTLELVQHPMLLPWLENFAYSRNYLLHELSNYGTQGTFDLRDIAAICAAVLLATWHFYWIPKASNGNGEH